MIVRDARYRDDSAIRRAGDRGRVRARQPTPYRLWKQRRTHGAAGCDACVHAASGWGRRRGNGRSGRRQRTRGRPTAVW